MKFNDHFAFGNDDIDRAIKAKEKRGWELIVINKFSIITDQALTPLFPLLHNLLKLLIILSGSFCGNHKMADFVRKTLYNGDRQGIKKKFAEMLKQRKKIGLNRLSWWGNRGVQIEIKDQVDF